MHKNKWAKRKGTIGERELINLFWLTGNWSAHRIAGSGSSQYPSPDVIAGNRIRKLAIEAKVTSDIRKSFPLSEIEGLKEFASIFGAEPWIAIKFNKEKQWYFLCLEDLKENPATYSTTLKDAKMKGLLFEELIR